MLYDCLCPNCLQKPIGKYVNKQPDRSPLPLVCPSAYLLIAAVCQFPHLLLYPSVCWYFILSVMSFFHPASHPLNPFGSSSTNQQQQRQRSPKPANIQQRPFSPDHPFFSQIYSLSSSVPAYSVHTHSVDNNSSVSPIRMQRADSTGADMAFDNASTSVASPPRKKIYVRTEEEQFVLPLSRVQTNDVSTICC